MGRPRHPTRSSRLRLEARSAGLKVYFTGKPCKHGHVAGRTVYASQCIDCVLKHDRRNAGLPEPTREAPKLCECCGRPPGLKRLSLDHDHKTGLFRGWLCLLCNTAIGKLDDSAAGVRRALAYLERHS